MRRPVISAARSGLRALALSLALPWLAAAAGAATVFDNYTGETSENFGTIDVAAAFTPTANFDFTGEAAFVVGQEGETPQDFTLSLYSSTGGSPGAALWTSDDLSVSGSASLVSAIYSGPAIPLQDGAQYFVVLHQLGAVNWWGGGSELVPIYIIEFWIDLVVARLGRPAIRGLRRSGSDGRPRGSDMVHDARGPRRARRRRKSDPARRWRGLIHDRPPGSWRDPEASPRDPIRSWEILPA